jgi:hypothetical protein
MVTSEKHCWSGIELFAGVDHPELIPVIPKILMKLYQADVLEEDVVTSWGAHGEPAEHFLEARFLDATGVLVGQSGDMKNTKSSKSWPCPSRAARPRLETTKIEVNESDESPESYALTRVSGEETVRA